MPPTHTVLTARRLYDGSRLHDHPIVLLDGSRIASITTRASSDHPRRRSHPRLP